MKVKVRGREGRPWEERGQSRRCVVALVGGWELELEWEWKWAEGVGHPWIRDPT